MGGRPRFSRAVFLNRGRVRREADVSEIADNVLEKMGKSTRQHDESFEQYLHRSRHRPEEKNWARVYVEGFHAARSDRISAGSLQREGEAADEIDGDRAFRLLNGYDSIPFALLQSIPEPHSVVRLNSAVERITWRRGYAEIAYRRGVDREKMIARCRQVLVAIPLGVLQAGAIRFEPEPRRILQAARALRFGQVFRITFRFADCFWEDDARLKDAGFLASQDRHFFTWWTMHPIIAPLLTAWMAGSAADRFRTTDPLQIAKAGLAVCSNFEEAAARTRSVLLS